MSLPFVNLTLKTSQINADNTPSTYFGNTIDNNIGTVGKNRTSITWKNVNLKTVLGDLYDKYDLFNISLNWMAGGEIGATNEIDNDNRMFQVKLSGLQFLSSYNPITQSNNNNTVVIKIIKITNTGGSVWTYGGDIGTIFSFKKQEMVNISIDLHTLLTDTYYDVGTDAGLMLGHMAFSFAFTPVESTKNDDVYRRFDLHP